jgi:hypothetical protein
VLYVLLAAFLRVLYVLHHVCFGVPLWRYPMQVCVVVSCILAPLHEKPVHPPFLTVPLRVLLRGCAVALLRIYLTL